MRRLRCIRGCVRPFPLPSSRQPSGHAYRTLFSATTYVEGIVHAHRLVCVSCHMNLHFGKMCFCACAHSQQYALIVPFVCECLLTCAFFLVRECPHLVWHHHKLARILTLYSVAHIPVNATEARQTCLTTCMRAKKQCDMYD